MKESDYILCSNLIDLRVAAQALRAITSSDLIKRIELMDIIRAIDLMVTQHETELNRRMK
jgi:hypothetical protein